MTLDVSSFARAPASGGAGLQAGYGVSFSDLGQFESAMHSARTRLEAQPVQAPSEALQAVARPLQFVNNEAARLGDQARAVMAAGQGASPSDIVMLTVRCQEFMFHCQLTSNVANRTSEGLQQLFRQQS